MKSLEISEVAKRSGLPASTLRYYESLGLIETTGRHGLKRLFHPSVLERLDIISLSRWAGFSLEEVGDWFGRDGKVSINKAQLAQKADEDRQAIPAEKGELSYKHNREINRILPKLILHIIVMMCDQVPARCQSKKNH